MESSQLLATLGDQALVLALAVTRLAVAMLVLPLFSQQLIPPLVRNVIFVSLALTVVAVQPTIDIDSLTGPQWVMLFAKELFVGLSIGFFFGLFLWAFESAGTLIDTQIGASIGNVHDPLSGHDVTLLGDFLGRWANFLFLSFGGLLFLTTSIIESFAVWPIDEPLPDLQRAAVRLFEREFGRYVTLTLMLCAPVMVVVFLVDMCMGLVNRFAKRLDILFISMAIKGLVTLLLLIVLIPMLVDRLMKELAFHRNGIEDMLRAVLG